MRGGGFTPWVTFQGTVETSTHMGLYAYLLEEQLEGILALADYLRTATRLQLVVILYPDEATSNLRTFAFVALHLLSTGRLGCISRGIPYIPVLSCHTQRNYVSLCHQKTEKE